MDDSLNILNQILNHLDKLADSTGIVKSILIGKIYEDLKTLKSNIESIYESQKSEKSDMCDQE